MWHINQKVVCLATFIPADDEHEIIFPQKGRVYHIREIIQDDDGDSYFLLQEILNDKYHWHGGMGEICEPEFWSKKFADIKSLEQAESLLHELTIEINEQILVEK